MPIHNKTSLSKSLILWFLLLSLVPLSLVSWVSYQQANSSLSAAAKKSLEESASLSARFIKNWFDYRIMDITVQGNSIENTKLLSNLIEGLENSKLPTKEYVKTENWINIEKSHASQLSSLKKTYDYIDNILLIDTQGNILYSLTNKNELGHNLFSSEKKTSLFSQSAKQSLISGKTIFSDLEHHDSSNKIRGFLNTPLLTKEGKPLGILTFQFHISRVINALRPIAHKGSTIKHYLVGQDGLLRTPVTSNKMEILNQEIEIKHWLQEDAKREGQPNGNQTFLYIKPNNKKIVSTQGTLKIPGVSWTVISVIDEVEALSPANWLGIVTLISIAFTIIFVIIIAIYQSKRITSPIITLLKATEEVASGKIHQRVDINSENEIGKLANSFNNMLEVRQKHEEELEKTTAQVKLAYTELRHQKHALDQHAIVAITDITGKIIVANNKFIEITGYREEEILNQNHRMLNSGFHDTNFFKQMFETISHGRTWRGEICNKAKDGHLYWVDTTITPFLNDLGKPERYIAIRTDITASKLAEEKAEAANQQKSEFLANMSHEIRTPMNGIIGMTGLLLETKLNQNQMNFAKNTMSSAESLLTIINDILDFSKIEAGKLDLENLVFDLRILTEDVSELMAIKCQEKNLEMLLRYKQNTPKWFIGDPGRIRQILLNLLSNAIKFTHQGSILITIESLEVKNKTSTLSCSIKDTGVGIEEKHLEKIFNKFDQEDGSTTRKYGGTGLGLPICKQLCEMMNGEIHVKSTKGNGTTFNFTMKLPLAKENIHDQPASINAQDFSGLNTLIIDDFDVARTIIAEQLSELDLTINTASSGEEGIDIMRKSLSNNTPFDIVITDYNMPKMNGKALVKITKSENLIPNGIIIFVTANPRQETDEELKAMGFDGYITKPTRPSELSRIISTIWSAKANGDDIPLVTRHILHEKQKNKKENITFKNTHILLAEDNPVNKLVATQYLEKYGCTITPAGNGLEAMIQLQENNFDLVFMDCQMPEMDGFEATRKIREFEKTKDTPRTPIIAFTANAMQGDKDICLAAGMDDYISKPININALEGILSKWLHHKMSTVCNVNDELENKAANVTNSQFNSEPFEALHLLFKNDFPSAVKQYTTSTEDNIISIEDALKKDDIKTLERMAHSIKGSSAQFGAIELNNIAQEMEIHAEKGDIEKIISLLPEMKIAQVEISNFMLKKVNNP